MSTPWIRAMFRVRSSALALLVTGIRAEDHDAPVPADHLALLAHGFDTRSDLHRLLSREWLLSGTGSRPRLSSYGGELHLHPSPGRDMGVSTGHCRGRRACPRAE